MIKMSDILHFVLLILIIATLFFFSFVIPKLEYQVKYLKEDIREIKEDIRNLKGDIKEVERAK